jgi:hypothetical protein
MVERFSVCVAVDAICNQREPTRLPGWLDKDGFHPAEDEAA